MSKSGRRTWFQQGLKAQSAERLDIVFAEEQPSGVKDQVHPHNSRVSMAASGTAAPMYREGRVTFEGGEGDGASENFFSSSIVKKEEDDLANKSSPEEASRKSWDVYIHTAPNTSDTKAVRNIIRSWREKEQKTLDHMKESQRHGYSSLERPSTLVKSRGKKMSSSIDELEAIFDNMKDKSFDSVDSLESQEAKYNRAGYFRACATPQVNRKVRKKTVTFKEEGRDKGKVALKRVQSPGVQMLFGSKSEIDLWESESKSDAGSSTSGDGSVEESSKPFNSILEQWKSNQKPFKYHTFDRSISPVVHRDMNSNNKIQVSKDTTSSSNNQQLKFDDFVCASTPVAHDKDKAFNLPIVEADTKADTSISEEEELRNIKIKERISAFETNKKNDGKSSNERKSKVTQASAQKQKVPLVTESKPIIVVPKTCSSNEKTQGRTDTTGSRKSATDMFRNRQVNHRSKSPGLVQPVKYQTAMDRSSSLTNLSQRSKSPGPVRAKEVKEPGKKIATQNGNLSHLLPKSIQERSKSDTDNVKSTVTKVKDVEVHPRRTGKSDSKLMPKTTTVRGKSEVMQKAPASSDKPKISQSEKQTKASELPDHADKSSGSRTSRLDMKALSPTPYKKPEKFTFNSMGRKSTNKTEKDHSNNLAKSRNAHLNRSVPNLSSEGLDRDEKKEEKAAKPIVVPGVAFAKSRPLPYKQASPDRGRGRLRTAWPPLDSSTKDESKEKDHDTSTAKSVSRQKSTTNNAEAKEPNKADVSGFQRAYRGRERSQSPGRSQWSTRLSLGHRSRQSFSELGRSLKRSLTPSMENLLLDEDIDYNKPPPDLVVKLSGRLYRGASEPNLFSQLDLLGNNNDDVPKQTADIDKTRSSFSSGYESQISDKDHSLLVDDSGTADKSQSQKPSPKSSVKKSRDYRRRTVSGDSFKEFAKLSGHVGPSGGTRVSERFLRLTETDELPKRETLDDLMNKPLPSSRRVKRSSSLKDFRTLKGMENVDYDWQLDYQKGSLQQQEEHDPVKIIRDDENGLVGYVFNV